MNTSLSNIITLKHLLIHAQHNGYAVGSFSPRYTPAIHAILRAGEKLKSPLIVQISQKELVRYAIEPAEFAAAFYEEVERMQLSIPAGLHLDHTRDFAVIEQAVNAGFTSVMIDASDTPLEENIAIVTEVVDFAHAHAVSVEAELGRLGSADLIESDTDEELYTDPFEAERFVRETGTDALAVSVGTAHGVYTVRKPKIDIERVGQIRARTRVALVLHGGSGTPAEMVRAAIELPGGGISKVNFATDLELALLKALGLEQHLTNAALLAYPAEELEPALLAVQAVVEDKITNYLGSAGKAVGFPRLAI